MEDIVVWTIVGGATLYLLRHFRQQFSAKPNCSGGCKSCSTIDWNALEQKAMMEQPSSLSEK